MRVTTDAVGGDVGTRCELRARAAPAIVAARGVEAVVHPDHGRGRREWGAHVENQPVEKTKLRRSARPLFDTLPLPNQGEVSQIQPRWPGMRDCVGCGAGSLTQAVLHRVDFPFWVCHYVIIMSRNKRAPQVKTVLMTHVSTCMSQAFF